MEELDSLRGRLLSDRPDEWERLPDLALYMDQLISYMPRQLIRFEEGDALTSAMVNNYIKDGLLPRAEGKRYGRAHLAYLTAICAMKPVLSVKEMATLMRSPSADRDPESLYRWFLARLDSALKQVAQTLEAVAEDPGEDDLAALALSLALDSYANKLACQRVLDLLSQRREEPEKDQKKKK